MLLKNQKLVGLVNLNKNYGRINKYLGMVRAYVFTYLGDKYFNYIIGIFVIFLEIY